jgi:hypothetical protein
VRLGQDATLGFVRWPAVQVGSNRHGSPVESVEEGVIKKAAVQRLVAVAIVVTAAREAAYREA